ncbi:MAG: response regulator transcription factor [Bacteroidota bacterium]|nr:response regulator transcription factor [Bacteroidota bacterium]
MSVKLAIVDDKAIVRRAIKNKLQSSTAINIVMEAANGKDFLKKMNDALATNWPEIVLMDIEMPEMDGIQTIAIASTLFPEIKFIVLTVFDNSEKIFEAIKAGANGYLLKDDEAVNLIEAVMQVANYNAVPMSPAIARKTLGLLKTGTTDDNHGKVEPGLLSRREYDVLVALVEGLEYKEIAEKLFISPATARTHIANIYQKLHVKSKAQAIKIAYKNRWV